MSLLQTINSNRGSLQKALERRAKLQKIDSADTSAATPRLANAPDAIHSASPLPDTSANEAKTDDIKRDENAIPTAQPKSFYSSKRILHVEERILRFLANVKLRLDGKRHTNSAVSLDKANQPATWQVFATQQAAFEYADHNDPEGRWLSVFAAEYNQDGKRRFLVTSYDVFWKRYRDMLPHHRHYYEIIRQWRPCHLYLDLEYQIQDNPDRDGVKAVDSTLSLLKDALLHKFGLEMQDDWVIELDSSSSTKFSRHIILLIPGKIFANNAHIGAFIYELCDHAKNNLESDPRCQELFVQKGENTSTLFIDTGVYTRNRAFRLYLSSKAGKDAVLMPTGRYRTVGKTQEEIFMDSLVCNVPQGAELLRCYDENEQQQRGADGSSFTGYGPKPPPSGRFNGSSIGTQCQYGPSPFPDVDAFVLTICNQGGVQGRIRSWACLDEASSSIMLYNIADNRWCENISRAHKSNGIFIVVDLEQGAWWQKCYDPECRGYRSPAMPLPDHLICRSNSSDDPQQKMVVEIENQQQDCYEEEEEEERYAESELAAIQRVEEEYITKRKEAERQEALRNWCQI